jgi:hypothetical protein
MQMMKLLPVTLLLVTGLQLEAGTISRQPDTLKVQNRIIISGVGDIMFGTSYPSEKYLHPKDDPMYLLGNLADTLAASDVTTGNLEGSFLDNGNPVKKCRDSTLCYLFRMPERYASALKIAGFDFLSLANNHFGDFGYPSRRRTMKLLDSLEIKYGGLLEFPFSFLKKDTLLFGFCAFAPNAGTLNINDIAGAERLVKYLADTCNIVIVSFHGGAEGSDRQHVPKANEMFYTESRGDVHLFAHRMIDAGADVVFGHGPHVTRAIELYRERFIAYSLGNFCTYGRFNLSGPNGIAPLVKVSVNVEGRFLGGRIIPVFQVYSGGVRIDPERRAIKKIRELTASDFPESGLVISDDGIISYK